MPLFFISYRRSDAPVHAQLLYERLAERFGARDVFIDLDTIEPGADFADVVEQTVASCDVLLAVIGPRWLAEDPLGVRRLDDSSDWVRLEIATALQRGIRVVPVLVDGGEMPSETALPDDLKALARRHAVELTKTMWREQVDHLLDTLGGAVATSAALPVVATPTIGRKDDVAALATLLVDPDARLVTVTGPGGVGKTRLAQVAVRVVEPDFPDGFQWVELAAVTRTQDVASTVARALAVVPLPVESAEAALRRYLANKQLLLVLDNFEQVADAAPFVGELVAAAPAVTVLITSRTPLELAGEHRFEVEPLALPAAAPTVSVAEVQRASATALFIAAARRHDQHFEIDRPGAAVAVARICARLDGLPLSIELAAARTPLLGVEGLAARLEHALDAVGSGPRDAPARQRTVRATIEWSHRLLGPELRASFQRLAVFAGGATLEAVELVARVDLHALDALIAHHLLHRRDGPRFAMLETVREFALECFAHDRAAEKVRCRHFEYYAAIVKRAVPELDHHGELEALRVLDAEVENVRAALRWALTAAPASALELAFALAGYWDARSTPVEGLQWLDAALAAAGDGASAASRAGAEFARWNFLVPQDLNAAQLTAGRALALARQAGDDASIAWALHANAINALLGLDLERTHELAQAAADHAARAEDQLALAWSQATLAASLHGSEREKQLEAATREFVRRGSHRALARSYLNVAHGALIQEEPAEAQRLLETAARYAGAAHQPFLTMNLAGSLGVAALMHGDLTYAREAFAQQLRLSVAHDSWTPWVAQSLGWFAAIAARGGECERAATLLGAARAFGFDASPVAEELNRKFYEPARKCCDPQRWHAAESRGEAMILRDAIAYALR